ncbi:MAG: S-methyl-5-thioribose-1-phosphate isomerase [Candidatus Omnitrophica bacterium]|nr:S-methyl-5-thioribose-1-phosphate isomerase [Candidatus Omnitrophota bacterium]
MTNMRNKSQLKESPLFWPAEMKKNVLHVLDETLIPKKMHYTKVKTAKEAVDVIKQMKTRAFGQFLVVLNAFLLELPSGNSKKKGDPQVLVNRLIKVAEDLNHSRPTFPFAEVTSIVVGWAKKAAAEGIDIPTYVTKNIQGYMQGIRARRLDRVQRIAQLIKNGDTVLTHCNVSGELAMAAAICKKEKKEVHFFATETRPYFQGAKLTCWELKRMGAQVTLIADNAVASVMVDGLVNKVIVGSDRSCANGDFANKIGTYQIAVLAKEYGIPFYVLTQPSDKVKRGEDITIEFRDPNELLKFEGRKIIPGKIKGFYPGFDVVGREFITEQVAINVH